MVEHITRYLLLLVTGKIFVILTSLVFDLDFLIFFYFSGILIEYIVNMDPRGLFSNSQGSGGPNGPIGDPGGKGS